MRTPKIASVLALCGAANLAHAADIPGVLGDPGVSLTTPEPDEVLPITWVSIDQNKRWVSYAAVTATGTTSCLASTASYDFKTEKFERIDNGAPYPSENPAKDRAPKASIPFWGQFEGTLTVAYLKGEPDFAALAFQVVAPDQISAPRLKIGSKTFNFRDRGEGSTNLTVTNDGDKEFFITLMDAIMRGRTAVLSSYSPSSDRVAPFIHRTFDLSGATAMANAAARACGAESANLGKPKPAPTARRKSASQPSQQARTTTQPRQQRTQTTTHQPREEDPFDDFVGHIAEQGLQMVVDEFTNEMFGDFGF